MGVGVDVIVGSIVGDSVAVGSGVAVEDSIGLLW